MDTAHHWTCKKGVVVAITFGKVPHPGYVDIRSEYLHKPEGYGWNNLGKRNPKFIALHRMVGTLNGTRIHFRTAAALTDYGLGIAAVDGSSAGVIHQYNDPEGYRSGWASGPVSAPYGDGLLVVQKYGINAVNRDGVSIETSGTDEPMDDFSWRELVHLCAYWIDRMKVPYTSLPLNPHTGINCLIWHQEFTIGSGKKCPFNWLMANTDRLYADIGKFLKPYQEGTVAGPIVTAPTPLPTPEKMWKTPRPVAGLALGNPDNAADFQISNGTNFMPVFDTVEAVKQGKQRMFAIDGDNVDVVGPDYKPGQQFEAAYRFTNDQGTDYYYLSNHARVYARDFKRVKD